MKAFKTRWRLALGAVAMVALWARVAPHSLGVVCVFLLTFGCVLASVQYGLEGTPKRSPARR
jgi:hypothetical protein